MSQPNGLLILGDHLFLDYQKKIGQRGLINTAGIINPNFTLYIWIIYPLIYIQGSGIPMYNSTFRGGGGNTLKLLSRAKKS